MNVIKRNSYTNLFKLKVIRQAETLGNRLASKMHGVPETNVRRWLENKEKFSGSSRSRKTFRRRAAQFPQLEIRLKQYVIDLREKGCAVSTKMLQIEAMKLKSEMFPNSNFKASYNWIIRFMNRNNLTIRRRTTVCQRLPTDYEEKLLEFQRYVISLRRINNYSLSQIGNADQTPVYFEMPECSTITEKGAKSVSILTGGNEKQRCTVMLSVTADGNKLPPFIIFKRKTLQKKIIFPSNVIVRAQPKGWMDNGLVEEWLQEVWLKRPGVLLNKRSMLVLDSYRGHLTNNIKDKLKDNKSDLAVIPGGLTSILQPLDVCINKPFKQKLKQRYSNFMATTTHQFTPSGRIKKPSLELIVKWVIDSWDEIDAEIIIKSFKKCCISNALDGSEDDLIWEPALDVEENNADYVSSSQESDDDDDDDEDYNE